MNLRILLPAILSFFILSCPNLLAENESNNSSSAIVQRAWQAFQAEDYGQAISESDDCITRYRKYALSMQNEMDGLDTTPEIINSRWALNDVGTALFIKAESLRKLDQIEDAKVVYADLAENFPLAQCWNPKGWFWQPAMAAAETLSALKSGIYYDFGDHSSETLTLKAWQALEAEDWKAAEAFAKKCIDLYTDQAKSMQAELKNFPKEPAENIFKYWALNDVGTAYFILAEVYINEGKIAEAKDALKTLTKNYRFAQCWDPKGWFWKPAEVARFKLKEL